MSNYKGPYNSFSQNAEPVYNQNNILGTVSQSGGVPTGAIIERGSNANGEYVKFADGTLILYFPRQTAAVTTPQGGGFTSPAVMLTYPLQPSALISSNGGGGTCSATGCFVVTKVLSSQVVVQVKSFTSVTSTIFDLCLLSRWY